MHDVESLSGATVTATSTRADEEGKITTSATTESEPTGPSIGPQHVEGYEKLAAMMGHYPAGAIFKQFGSLNALNLLYYQAELCRLERQLKKFADEDRQSDNRYRKVYFQSQQWLSQGKISKDEDMSPDDNKQWLIVLRIREVLKEYSES